MSFQARAPRVIRNRSGQTVVEYTLILVLVSIVAIFVLALIGHATGTGLNHVVNKVQKP